jgi:hypothetical protein
LGGESGKGLRKELARNARRKRLEMRTKKSRSARRRRRRRRARGCCHSQQGRAQPVSEADDRDSRPRSAHRASPTTNKAKIVRARIQTRSRRRPIRIR